jgi:hypothetical protein
MATDVEIAAARYFIGEFDRLRKRAGNPAYDALMKVSDAPRATLHTRITVSGLQKSLADWLFFRPLVRLCIGLAADHGFSDVGTEYEWKEFWKASADGRKNLSPLETTAAHEKARKTEERARVLASRGVTETLRAIYPAYPLVNLWEVPMPICEFPALPAEWDNTESAVGRLVNRYVPAYDEYSQEFDPAGGRKAFGAYVKRYQGASEDDRRHFFPGATYSLRMLTFGRERTVLIDCTMGRYFTSLATSEDLDPEMMEALSTAPDKPVPLSALPRRSWLHGKVEDPVVDGRHRAAAVSHAAVVMAANTDGGYDIMLPVRAHNVATHAEFNHVAPSGIFAPYDESSPSPMMEFSVRRNFYREWVEELYAAEEHERPSYSVVIPDPEDEPEITRLNELLNPGTGKGHLYYTGVSVNLLTMRPEICMLLLIEDTGWFREENRIARETGRPFAWGWEYEESPWAGVKMHNKPEQLQLRLDANLQPADGVRLEPSFLIPNAGAAISLAIRMIKSKRNEVSGGANG